jgi:hypothetical protein
MRAKISKSTAVKLALCLVLVTMLALTPLLAQTGANTGLQQSDRPVEAILGSWSPWPGGNG